MLFQKRHQSHSNVFAVEIGGSYRFLIAQYLRLPLMLRSVRIPASIHNITTLLQKMQETSYPKSSPKSATVGDHVAEIAVARKLVRHSLESDK